jgi:hypothetical protein
VAAERGAGVACVAAAVASAGDLLLLLAANAGRPEAGALPPPSEGVLVLGHYLGVLAIPLYALGYRQVAAALATGSPRIARWVFGLGAYGSALGGSVHGLTALLISTQRRTDTPLADPLAFVAHAGPYLLPLATLVMATLLAGSILYTVAVLRGGTALPSWMAAASPALLVAILGTLAWPSLALRSFVVPAAPNLAHVIFFALVARATMRH